MEQRLLFVNPNIERLDENSVLDLFPDDSYDSITNANDTLFVLVYQGKVVAHYTKENDDCVEGHHQNLLNGKQQLLVALKLNGKDLQKVVLLIQNQNTKLATGIIKNKPILSLIGRQRIHSKHIYFYACDISHIHNEDIINSALSSVLNSDSVYCITDLQPLAYQLCSIYPDDCCVLSIARGLSMYHRGTQFCRYCGFRTEEARHGTCRVCLQCQRLDFPRQDPAMIVLVTCGPYCLLGRKPFWQKGRFSCLAGYTAIGEPLENTVVREVFEESQVHVDPNSIRYQTSQPWVFPQSLMFGFYASAIPERDDDTSSCLQDKSNSFLVFAKEDDRGHSYLKTLQSGGYKSNITTTTMHNPLITSGGVRVKSDFQNKDDSTIILPPTIPDVHELEEVLWFHIGFLREWLKVDLDNNNNNNNNSSIMSDDYLPTSLFHIPSKEVLAGHLILKWIQNFPSMQ